ncbi:MAG: hypothetical protein JO095_17810 [Alphaproteobacteria bacterium]|nr:hypothetical protein [Alphaproteobacteria bacterium]
MRKLLLASCAVLALGALGTGGSDQSPAVNANNGGKANAVAADGTGSGQWLSANNGSRIYATNKDVGNTTTTTVSGNTLNDVKAALSNSVVDGGTLSQTTTNTRTTTTTTTANGGQGSSFNTANLTSNRVKQIAADASASGSVTMTNAMGGQGILQANQNTGANSVQQNSVALTSTVGGSGGGLNGFSPTAVH